MDIQELREQINGINDQMTKLFEQRMQVASQIADYKKANNMMVMDASRERDIISTETDKVAPELQGYTKILYHTLFDLSRSYQDQRLGGGEKLKEEIETALNSTPQLFPEKAMVACQGVEGAYSSKAADKLFSMPKIIYMNSFKGVFQAVDKGLCQYGILPIENSLHGSVNEVYDLMKKYKFYIARSVKLQINHSLLGNRGADLSSIKEIVSHEQAIGQCAGFLEKLGVKITVAENTAMAAKTVAQSGRNDSAAIASKSCADEYGLKVIESDIQDNDNNYTRFICISKNLQIFPGANKISIMFNVSHRPGSLYSLISKFSALGLNLTKLESRPIPGKDFEFMFYMDMEASIYSDAVKTLLSQLSSEEEVTFLGGYYEV